MRTVGKFFDNRLVCHVVEVIDHLNPLVTQKAAVLKSPRSFHAGNIAGARARVDNLNQELSQAKKELSQGRDGPGTVHSSCFEKTTCWKPREWSHLPVRTGRDIFPVHLAPGVELV